MDETTLNNYKKAGNIAAVALDYGKDLIKKDAKILDICNKIEIKIKELGADMAFPVQISLNDAAAHYCPEDDDQTILSDQVCCLDVGVHVDGCIGDNACSVDLSGNHNDLVKASSEALRAATEILKVGIEIGKIGKVVEETIKGFGFQPVRNLSGHGLDLYNIHSSPSIPNFDTKEDIKLEKGRVIAIEPFATDGAGIVNEKGDASVYMLYGKKGVRVGFVKEILKHIGSYKGLPFTTRWLTKEFSVAQVRFALNQINQLGILRPYPPLIEKSNGLVSQAENSFYIDDEVLTLTKK